jgi:hypothetical protein
MKVIGAVILVVGSAWAFQDQSWGAELWRCVHPDGTEIFTNKTEALSNCQEYDPKSVLRVLPAPKDNPTIAEGQYPEPARRRSRIEPPEERRQPGQISFETFRMLSTGMTETEILERAGAPKHRFRLSLGTVVWAYANDDWIVEITFSGGRAAEINRYRARP